MRNNYEHYDNITKEILETIRVGDLIKINNWKKPMRVKGVSENYFVMTQNIFGNTYYSVCSKIAWNGIKYNGMRGGMFHCGTDNYIFGSPLCLIYENLYKFEDQEANMEYLKSFENEECELSQRNSVAIHELYIKRM